MSLRRIALLSVLCASIAACKGEPPTTVEGWAAEIPELQREKDIAKAADELRKVALAEMRAGNDLKDKVPVLVPLLDEDYVVRQHVAYLLGEIGEKSAGPALLDAIDYSAAVSDKHASRANGAVAEALGKVGDKSAVKPLLKLTKSRDSFTALAAVKALGGIGDTSAVDPLMAIATDENIDPFISRNAIESLGRIGDPKSMPALIQMLFRERRGVSFYRESSFAIFQVGEDATDKLIDIIDGKNKELMTWAEEKNILEAAIYAKTAQVLGDLSDRRAIPALRRRLKYESEYADMRLLPRMFSAEALGRIRAKEATSDIAGMLEEEEANARGTYTRSLVMIGDRRALPALVKASTTGFGYDAREEALWGVARLGSAGSLKDFDAAVKTNENVKTCMAWFEGDKEAIQKECETRIEKFQKRAEKHRPMLEAAEECKNDVDCWLKKLQDENGKIREKAAWELARLGDAKTLVPLLAAVQDDDLLARFAMIHAIDTLLFGDNDQKPEADAANKAVDRLDVILDDEKGKSHYTKINEDVKRLALKIRRYQRQEAASEG